MENTPVYKRINGMTIHDFFHINTSLNLCSCQSFTSNIQAALTNENFIHQQTKVHKYDDSQVVKLSDPSDDNFSGDSLFNAIKNRRSVRRFADKSILEKDFSNLIKYSFGITGYYEATKEKDFLMLYAYPSAGGLNPLNFYLIVHKVEGIENGVYLYDPYHHQLVKKTNKFHYNEYDNITIPQQLARNWAFSVYIVGNLALTGFKYGDRGYRFMTLEAGHAAQNLYLTATCMNLGVLASGGFLDGEFLNYINLVNGQLYLLYELYVGVPDSTKDCRFY